MRTTPWLKHFKELLQLHNLPYHDAHTVIGDPDEHWYDETSHEWWKDDRTIAVFERKLVTFEGIEGELLKVWGPNIHTEMEIVSLHDDDALIAAWKWFLRV